MKLLFCKTLRLCCGVLIAIVPTSGFAGIIVSFDNLTLTTGGPSGFVDVYVQVATGDPDVNIDFFAGNVIITPVGLPSSIVSFRKYNDPVTGVDHNGDHQFADGNYLFAMNSLDIGDPLDLNDDQHAGSVSPDGLLFGGGDGRLDFDPMNEPGNFVTLTSMPKLLYRLELLATGTATGTETFQLLLSTDPLLLPPSQFIDNDGNEITFTSNFGQITVTQGAAAVPEPATGVVLLLGTGLLAWRRSRKCRHHAAFDEV